MDREHPKTTTRVVTRVSKTDVRKALAMGTLTPLEERFVRLRLGIGEPNEAPLPRRHTGFSETRAAIAMYEKAAYEHLRSRRTKKNPVRDKLIRKLKDV